MSTLEPRPGFDWSRVRWTGPSAPVDDTCSYCGAAIPDDCAYVPLRLWSESGWAAVFCDACMGKWWGFDTTLDDGDDEPSDPFVGSEADRAEWESLQAIDDDGPEEPS